MEDIRKLFMTAKTAKKRLDRYKVEYEKAEALLLEAMQERGFEEIRYNDGTVIVQPAKPRVSLDQAKVKELIPNWQEVASKTTQVRSYLRWKI